MPPAPILSGGLHLRVVVVSVTSSTIRCWGSLVGAVSIQGMRKRRSMRAQRSQGGAGTRAGVTDQERGQSGGSEISEPGKQGIKGQRGVQEQG